MNIATPKNLTKEQKEALRKFSELLGEETEDKGKGFFKKR